MIETVAESEIFKSEYLFDNGKLTLADLYLIPLIIESNELGIDFTKYSKLY